MAKDKVATGKQTGPNFEIPRLCSSEPDVFGQVETLHDSRFRAKLGILFIYNVWESAQH
jgi:hypothetical protein